MARAFQSADTLPDDGAIPGPQHLAIWYGALFVGAFCLSLVLFSL